MSRILLLLDQKENEQLLAAELSARDEVIIASTDDDLHGEFDLCVLDGRSLDRVSERVLERRQREMPIMLPVLLVTSRPGVKMITRHVWQSVDELIITPIEKPELRARIEILLRARAQSLALRARAEDAEQAAHSRDEVLAVVSHDLRNPLNLVMTNAAFLLDTMQDLPPRSRELLEMIQRATGQMTRLIGDLLEVAGIEAGNVAVTVHRTHVEPIVSEACASLEHAAATESIELSCTCDDGLPEVCADSDRVLQVLGNLIGNALKFTPAGGKIHVTAARRDDAVLFSVTDTGNGILEEELPHVFDRFWQARRERKGGAGLGLAISLGIVRAHGGDMWVESEVGRGSTFYFTLPSVDATASAEPASTAS